MKMSEKGYKSDFILYEYCQQLFEMSIKKFPNDIILKSNYIIYLIIQMSKKKLAQKIFDSMQEKMLHFQNNYIIFCCKKYLETYTPSTKKNFEEYNKNIIRAIEYEKLYILFKDYLLNVSTLYYEFWSSLYKSHLQGTEDFIKLNDIGEKLNLLIDKIDDNFHKLFNVKGDDLRIINLYSGFLRNVLNNKKKYDNLNKILISSSNEDKIQDKEVDFSNYDLKVLNNSDEYKYAIVSAAEENLGTVLNISLNACQVFGYNKNEVIGKKASMLFPEIYQKKYEEFLIQYTNNVKSKFYDILSHKKEYYPEFLDIFIDGKNKSKYLLPLYLKVFFTQTEESEHVYVVNFVNNDIAIINKLNEYFNLNHFNSINSKELQLFNYCYVLTDRFFNIQTFTPNCQELLGLSTNALNSNIDITNFIEQFKEDVNKMIKDDIIENSYSKNEKSDINILNYSDKFKMNYYNTSTYKTNIGTNQITGDNKIIFKRYIAENKYSEVKIINWKIYELVQILANQNSNSKISERNLKGNKNNNQYDNYFNKKNIIYGNIEERSLLLVIKKAKICGKHVGYKFYFKREKLKSVENEEEINKNNNNLKLSLIKSKKNSNISFRSLFIKDNNNENNNEGIILNSSTNKNNDIRISKSMKYPKKENEGNIEIIENFLEDKHLKNSQIEYNYIDISRIGSNPFQKGILKKRPTKFASLDVFSDNNLNEIMVVTQNFIPISDFSFILDLDSLSFKPLFNKNQSEKIILNTLKNEAMAKVKQYQIIKKNLKTHKISFSSYNSSYEDTESYEEDNSSLLSSNFSISKEKKNKKKTIVKKSNVKFNEAQIQKDNRKEELEGQYYRVNGLNKIKFMIYDFDQEMVINKGISKDMKSEVENLIINYKLKIPTGLDEDMNDPSLKVRKILSSYSINEFKKEKSTNINNNNINNNSNIPKLGLNNQKINYKEQEIYKRLENALNKNDKEKIIIKFYISIVLSLITVLAIACFIFIFTLSNLNTIKNNILLIIYSTNLRHYTNMEVYYVREITILHLNENISSYLYDNYPINKSRTDYLIYITDTLKNIFFEGHHNMELMMGMNLNINENNTISLSRKPLKTEMIYDLLKTRIITSTLYVSIAQIYSNLYHLLISDDLSYQNKQVFNFLHNAINNVAIGLENVIDIYLNELQIRKHYYIIYSYIILIVSFFVYIGIYFLIKISYIKIINRKESYISVFYGINLSFIKASMLKCEQFINKINPNELVKSQEKNDEYDESISFSNFNDDFTFINKSNTKNNNKNNQKNNQIRKKIKFKEISKNRIFTVKLIGIVLFSYAYVIIVLLKFIFYMNNVEIMGSYIHCMQDYHNNLLNLFNAYREFIFCNETKMYNMPIFEYLEAAEKHIYNIFTSDINYISDNCNRIKGLCQIYRQIQKSQNYQKPNTDFSNNVPDSYMEVVTSLGFYNFINFWMEEIRIKKNYILMLENSHNKTTVEDRIIYFYNYQVIHPDVNYMFITVIIPYITKERTLSTDTIIKAIKSENTFYIVILILFFIISLLFYIFFWRPIINNIKNLIYKTKNMLRIIPIEILEAQTNIKSLLGVSDLNE